MRAFSSSGYLLSDARLEVRLVYTGFLALAVVGMLTMAAFQLKHVGPTPERVAVYYRGGLRDGAMVFPKGFRELVEVTHFHAFSMGVVYLVLAHLFLATGASDALKRAGVGIGAAGLLGDVAGVWLVRYVAAGFAWLQLGSWCCEWLGFATFVGFALHEMWFAHGRRTLPPE
jgi:hypothetical protein